MSNGLKRVLALGALFALSLPAVALAAEGPYATFDIKVESTAADSEVSPVVTSPITKDQVQFHIINNTGKALYFSNGNEQSYIPVVSNSTVTAPYTVGREYKVVDGDGHTVAKWNLNGGKSTASSVSSASAEQYTQWGNTIQQVLANQKVSYVEPAAKSEPHYYYAASKPVFHVKTASHTTTHRVIRGFW